MSKIPEIILLIFIGLFGFVVIYQIFYRQAPLICGDQILPSKSDYCAPPERTELPVGSIVAFFGRDSEVPLGWTLCDGRDNPKGSMITLDSNDEIDGVQLPDLRQVFVRGSQDEIKGELPSGGNDSIEGFHHSHLWSQTKIRNGSVWWISHRNDGEDFDVGYWGTGFESTADRGRSLPFLFGKKKDIKYYTSKELNHLERIDNRPKYVSLRYIIKIF